MTNHIAIAVEPLRVEAVKRAHEHALTTVENIRKRLSEANWDANVVAPYPSSVTAHYQMSVGFYHLVRQITKSSSKNGCRYQDDPEPVFMNSSGIKKFVAMAEKNANDQYDAFIKKLNSKVGDCISAVLEGNHVWGYSFLTIENSDGSTEIWKTQMIVNVSKLGKIFNQFPTRKSKLKN
jgi:hypothetical protein